MIILTRRRRTAEDLTNPYWVLMLIAQKEYGKWQDDFLLSGVGFGGERERK